MHMSHITSDRGDDLERSTRMAEYERESMIDYMRTTSLNIEVLQRAMRLKTGSLQNVSCKRSSRHVPRPGINSRSHLGPPSRGESYRGWRNK